MAMESARWFEWLGLGAVVETIRNMCRMLMVVCLGSAWNSWGLPLVSLPGHVLGWLLMHLVTGSCWFHVVDWLLFGLWLVCWLLWLWDQSFVCGGVCKGCNDGHSGMSVGLVSWGVVWVHMSLVLVVIEVWGDTGHHAGEAERWSTVEVHFKATPGVCKFLAQHWSMSSCDTNQGLWLSAWGGWLMVDSFYWVYSTHLPYLTFSNGSDLTGSPRQGVPSSINYFAVTLAIPRCIAKVSKCVATNRVEISLLLHCFCMMWSWL